MKSVRETRQFVFISLLILALLAFIAGPCFADGPVMKIAPKGKKKITIGVMDPNAALETAAYINKAHKAQAAKRGWNIQFVDLKDNIPQAATYMENMISAGYDGIVIHWLPLRAIDKQIKMAFDKGIPVVTIAASGARFPGVLADVGFMEATDGAMLAEYLGNRLQSDDKIVTISIPQIEKHQIQLTGAKGAFQAYNLKVVQDLQFPFTGDPFQWTYDQVTNTLLGDSKKEIKGIYTTWEGFGIQAARACHDRGRDDVIVVTCDDRPNTYKEMARLPALQAVAATSIHDKNLNEITFGLFDKVFRGESVVSQKNYPHIAGLLTKDKLPPSGYFYDVCGGYKARKPDFEVK